jgi:hypothetical protein
MTAPNAHARRVRRADFRFYEELNDFLPRARRKLTFGYAFHGTPSIRDAVQALGVPHTAIDLVLVDGCPVDFAYRLKGGERVAVYPAFERLDIGPVARLRPRPLRETRFAADVHLGRLARYLRMLGFDTLYDSRWRDAELIDAALAHGRIILTRDVGLLKHKRVTHGYWVRHHQPLKQLREVTRALDVGSQTRPFTRCMHCNGGLRAVGQAQLEGRVDAAILVRFDDFRECTDCGKVYWKGSHYRRMLDWVRRLRPIAGKADP